MCPPTCMHMHAYQCRLLASPFWFVLLWDGWLTFASVARLYIGIPRSAGVGSLCTTGLHHATELFQDANCLCGPARAPWFLETVGITTQRRISSETHVARYQTPRGLQARPAERLLLLAQAVLPCRQPVILLSAPCGCHGPHVGRHFHRFTISSTSCTGRWQPSPDLHL